MSTDKELLKVRVSILEDNFKGIKQNKFKFGIIIRESRLNYIIETMTQFGRKIELYNMYSMHIYEIKLI